jgi:hypothetical protein
MKKLWSQEEGIFNKFSLKPFLEKSESNQKAGRNDRNHNRKYSFAVVTGVCPFSGS